MKRIQIVAAAGAVLAMAAVATGDTLGTVGVYDSTSNPNSVDAEAPGNFSTLAAFTTNVASAFAADAGGVIDFTTGWDGAAGPTTWTVTYGAGGSKTFLLSTPTVNPQRGLKVLADDDWDTNEAISGTSYGLDLDGRVDTHPGHVFRLDFHTFSTSGEGITELALTALSRDAFGGSGVTFTFTAFFDDASSATIVDVVTGGQSVDDTFFAFGAPTGRTIVALEATGTPNNSTALRLNIDDLAFITSALSETADLTIKKFFDCDLDDTKNGEDIYLSGWQFNVSNTAHGGSYDQNHTTDVNGEINLTGLDGGDYDITETPKGTGWVLSGANPRMVTVSGTTVVGFGNNLPGDANQDEKVNLADFTILKANFGLGAPSAGGTPEPITMAILAVGTLGLLRKRRA